LLLVLAEDNFADIGTAKNHEQRAFLSADIAEALHQTGRKRDCVPWPEFSLALAVLTPAECPSSAERYEYLDDRVAVQRRTFTRLHSVEGNRKAMIAGNGGGGPIVGARGSRVRTDGGLGS